LERFLENDGILLSDKQLDKQVLKWMLDEQVSGVATLIIYS